MKRLITTLFRNPSQGAERAPSGRAGRRICAQQGQGMVEFALVLPLLLLLLFGIIELGRLMVIYTSVAAASREGARFGSASGQSDNGVPYYADIEGIQDAAMRMLVLIGIPRNQITVNYDSGPDTTPCASETACGGIELGDRVRVRVTANYDPLLGLTPLQPFQVTSLTSRTIIKDVAINPGTGGGGGGGGGTNNPPQISITQPQFGINFQQGEAITFAGQALDIEDGDISANIQWDSDRDGSIGTGASFSISTLSPGLHHITAQITDSDGNFATASITIYINTPPTVDILSPENGWTVEEGTEILFAGMAQDDFDDTTNILVWTDNGTVIADHMDSFAYSTLTVGLHTIQACATDSGGLTGCDTISVAVSPITPPDVRIITPTDGAFYSVGSSITFVGLALDVKDGDISSGITWFSDRQGRIGVGASVTSSALLPGTHVISAVIFDSDGLEGRATITIRIVDDQPPIVDLLTPDNGDEFAQGTMIDFSATATDATDGDLSDDIIWRSSIIGQFETGPSFSLSTLPPGIHTISAEATDSDGLTGSDAIVIYIVEHNDPPVVNIDAPPNNSPFPTFTDINFRGTATDPQDGLISNLIRWASSVNGDLGTGASITTTLSVGFHTITATVTDRAGLTATDTIRVTVWQPICPSPGSTVWSYQNSNFADKVSWFLTIPTGVTQTQPYVMDYLRIVLDNTSASVSSITVEGIPVPPSQIRTTGTIVEVLGPVWTGYFRANNTIEVIIDFQPKPRRNSDGPFSLMATFQGCSGIQTTTRP